ncbi:NAD(P)H-dependent glycerol-3-phosphate dehydrogenase [Asticcacaulis sp. EMRT-3]|uniref:NAD(P)H-dependent glycerol-3-phosphate dehydrogenase n=1 Tax=Asticcacaulis sp. EMRT-3 TaxID=3040349 RepID=UPI0024AF0518|nr:NAD(P)H-dependent glycerol-3-phosphate dehydrogenase [Asticcacaulis sp. EMRT-3]MDI7776160.1 NAD(P)H-dependent glycerol-3-phosphate dehydrogenase [Asticcacaulis sp. EMRT-3]
MTVETFTKVGVIGAGAWGTALAQVLTLGGNAVLLHAREAEVVASIRDARENTLYLPGVTLSDAITVTSDLAVLAGCDLILAVPPAQHMRATLTAFKPFAQPGLPVVLCAKGVERGSDALMTEVLGDVLPEVAQAVLAGPNFAREVALGLPSAVTLACADMAMGAKIAATLAGPTFRPYQSNDLIGAESGGAIKNVIAIACGIAEGKGLGRNAHAALITRGFAEMTRLAMAMGAQLVTMTGLCGMGDLVLTCSSPQSRNMSVGLALGKGQTLEEALAGKVSVAEGVQSAPAVCDLGRKFGVDLPLCNAVNAVLTGALCVDGAIDALLSRPLKTERV